jgi:hypothetical protein
MSTSLTLPPQFKALWKVDGQCRASTLGTGLDVADTIEIETRVGLKITLANGNSRTPDPLLLQGLTLTVVNPNAATAQNVLTATEASSLCTGSVAGFSQKFWKVLMSHNFELTYLAGSGTLAGHPHATDMVFLPYVVQGDESNPQFFLAVTDGAVAVTHNGIVHGHP